MIHMSDRYWTRLTLAAILFATIFRFYVAWHSQYLPIRDGGIAMLMAKHMAEGTGFPVFFYGQAYMGSLEPAVSALFEALFGPSPYANCAGTTILGCLVVVIISLLARDIGGARAGFFAATACIIASDVVSYYSTHPRGGYMTLLVLGLLVLRHTNRFAARALDHGITSVRDLVLAGLYGGLGWWSNQMIIVFFAAAGLIMLPFIRSIFRRGAVWWALLAFAAGSLPWWWWNFHHDWATFAFSSSFQNPIFKEGLARLFDNLPHLLGYHPVYLWPNIIRIIAALIGLVIAAWQIKPLLQRLHRESLPGLTLISVFLVIISMVIFYSLSHFSQINTSRYLIPVAPALTVLIGVAAWALWEKRNMAGRVFAVSLLLMTIPWNSVLGPDALKTQNQNRQNWARASSLADAMHEKGDGIAAGESPLYWVNYANLERGILVNIPTDFYAPYDRLFAKASRQLFVNNFKGIRAHLYASGAYWRESSIEGFRLIYDIDPPDNQWDYLPASSVKAVKAGPPDADLKPVIMDENLETVYIVEVNSNKPAVIEWEFENAINVCGLLIMNPGESRPEHINIAFHTERDGWIDMPETLEITGHFWSGPRIFYEGFEYLQQLRFRPPPGGISILRMTISSTETSDRVMIPEALLLIESANTEEATTVDPVEIARWIAQIHQSKASRVYAPRWIAEQMHGQLAAGIDLRASYYLDRDMQALPREDDPSAPYLDLAARTALLIENRDLVRSRAHLEGLNIRWDEIAGRSHTLFIIQPLDAATHLETVVPIFWTDRGLFAGNGRHDRIRRADQLYQRFSSTRDSEKRQQLIEACVRLAPEHEVAWNDYHTLMNGQLTPDLIQLYKHSRPQIVLEGKFAGGIELAGLTITPQMVRAGELVTIDYFWRIKPGADITKWSTFVHFLKGKNILLQDDHNLSEEVGRMVVANQTFAHLFKISRTVRAPESSGKLDIGLGLVNPLTQKRARVDSPHELRKNVLVATDALDVR